MQGISIVIPAYGRVVELKRAINSVATECPEKAEIIVVDDCSPSPLGELIPSRNAGGITVRVVRMTKNRGAGVSRSLGIRRARFDHVAFLDSDDTFAAGKLDVLVEKIAATNADVFIHPVAGAEFYNRLMARWHKYLSRFLPFRWLIVLLNPIPTPGLTVRRLRRLGHPSLRHAEDWAFLLRYVDKASRVEFIPQTLASLHRPIGSEGGLSAARTAMRSGEFAARRLLLKNLSAENLVRFSLGTLVGTLRLALDQARWLIKGFR